MFLQSKQGSILDGIHIIVSSFVFGIMGIIGWVIWRAMQPDLVSNLTNDTALEVVNSNYSAYVPLFDWGFLIVLFMLFIGMIISSVFIDSNPAWFIISFVLLILTVLISGILGNVFYDFAQDSAIALALADFTYIPFVMSNFLPIAGALTFIGMIALYVRSRG